MNIFNINKKNSKKYHHLPEKDIKMILRSCIMT